MALLLLAPVFAAEEQSAQLSENIQSVIDGLDLEELQSYIDEYSGGILDNYGTDVGEIVSYLTAGNLSLDYGEYISGLLKRIFGGVTAQVPIFAQIMAVSILWSLCSGGEDGLLKKTTASAVRLACITLIMLMLSAMIVNIMSRAIQSVQRLKLQAEIITPVLITLTVLTGGSASGAVFQPAAIFLSGGAIEIINGIIFPLIIAAVVLGFLSRLNPSITFTGMVGLIKSVMKWVIGITVAVFGLFVTVQGGATSLFNGIFFKVTKYLVGNSVPIVGNFLSSGFDMIVMAGSVVRSAVGLTGICLIVGEIVGPLVMAGSFSLMLKFVGAIVQPLSNSDVNGLFTDIASDIDFVIAAVLMIAFMYIIVVIAMVNSVLSFI